jgi:hypothetical protein
MSILVYDYPAIYVSTNNSKILYVTSISVFNEFLHPAGPLEQKTGTGYSI